MVKSRPVKTNGFHNKPFYVLVSCSVMSDSLQAHGLKPAGLLSVHGILQARLLEGLPFPSPGESSWPRDQTQVSCIVGRFFTIWAMREAQINYHRLRQTWIETERNGVKLEGKLFSNHKSISISFSLSLSLFFLTVWLNPSEPVFSSQGKSWLNEIIHIKHLIIVSASLR